MTGGSVFIGPFPVGGGFGAAGLTWPALAALLEASSFARTVPRFTTPSSLGRDRVPGHPSGGGGAARQLLIGRLSTRLTLAQGAGVGLWDQGITPLLAA